MEKVYVVKLTKRDIKDGEIWSTNTLRIYGTLEKAVKFVYANGIEISEETLEKNVKYDGYASVSMVRGNDIWDYAIEEQILE